MQSFPEIETARLRLTELKAGDIPQIVQLAANPRISDYTLNLPFPYAEKDALYWLNLAHQGYTNGTHLIFAVRLKPENAFLGGIGLTLEPRFDRAEIGYWLGEPYWNQGYATEATGAIIRFGFGTLGLNKLTSSYLAQNPASGRVMQKSGMTREGELQEHVRKGNAYHTLILYGLTRSDFEKNNGR
ncbi:MAG: GNAT family N-acetyltransferase [Cytophagales bacterium]|nr:GNAT family N-acetyltransferase [Cytophagales bacterium]